MLPGFRVQGYDEAQKNAVLQVKCCVIPAQRKDLGEQEKSNAAHHAFVIDGLCLCNS